jgi:hypothetical protein
MIPFSVRPTWYEEYWYGDEPTPKARPSLALLAGRVVAVFAVVIAGLRGLGHH